MVPTAKIQMAMLFLDLERKTSHLVAIAARGHRRIPKRDACHAVAAVMTLHRITKGSIQLPI